jgi:3D (Asp-Asp-Asp) domain-containing protein
MAAAVLAAGAVWLAPATPAQARWLLPAGGRAVVAGTLYGGMGVHARPGPDDPVLAVLPEGTEVMVTGAPVWAGDGLYYPIRYSPEIYGWGFDFYLAAGDVSIFASGFSIRARLTGYSDGPEGGAIGFITRTGTVTRWGTVAVDPAVIPLGSRVIIQGMPGVYQAEDTGSGVRGEWLDIWFPTPEAARQFGVHDGIVVTVLGW